ncbi:predicted protein [Plenodomus lingam JN3]|uniref:Uncharacterized protein n=1 Tax=Leptosphaeria maculans (strain JN3 / isolate v23.1.3 / race Av1-4-5-6-7-8) TaxID=985895 RepID=E5A691_LEPMJ|nr:predicted protein [Plenodomus lingam JN3]CBX99136.1 predicted protein [Plenodomus lingam JN3]
MSAADSYPGHPTLMQHLSRSPVRDRWTSWSDCAAITKKPKATGCTPCHCSHGYKGSAQISPEAAEWRNNTTKPGASFQALPISLTGSVRLLANTHTPSLSCRQQRRKSGAPCVSGFPLASEHRQSEPESSHSGQRQLRLVRPSIPLEVLHHAHELSTTRSWADSRLLASDCENLGVYALYVSGQGYFLPPPPAFLS